MTFPTQALDPSGKLRTILVDAQGRVVTDAAAKPAQTYPITQRSAQVDASGNLKTT